MTTTAKITATAKTVYLRTFTAVSSLVTYPFGPRPPPPSFISLQASSILSLPLPTLPSHESPRCRALLHILTALNQHPSLLALESALNDYAALGDAGGTQEEREKEVEWTLVRALVVRTWEECMEKMLVEAGEDQDHAEWWGRAERVGGGAGWYLLQTLPNRIYTLSCTLLSQPSPLRALLDPVQHLPSRPPAPAPSHLSPLISHLFVLPPLSAQMQTFALLNPLRLARFECHAHRQALENARDERAQALGVGLDAWRTLREGRHPAEEDFTFIVGALQGALSGTATVEASRIDVPYAYVILLQSTLSSLRCSSAAHAETIAPHLPPSALTRLWPSFVLLPPVVYFSLRAAYVSRERIIQGLNDARATVEGFLTSWVLDPLRDIVRTVRTGEGDLHVVSKEGLKSDMDSLERMAVQLAADKLHYTPEQQRELADSVRAGDLTPVLRLYEHDIRTPLRSAMGGTLVRSLLIQVQKTKVDVDLALNGIDRLLRSQELTFAFVGVAPSLAVCYGVWTWLSRLWNAGKGRGRYGGERRRADAWLALRRTEMLLLSSSANKEEARMQGLLLLSLHTLRTYAQTCLPARSRLRQGFLEDVGELERVSRRAEEKRAVVGRMRADWGGVLGWGEVAGNA